MASGYTANYGLSLWEPGDAFVRTEFNGDNEKIDAALRAAEEETARVERMSAGAAAGAQASAQKALDALVPVCYNVYNLILRDSYEGKAAGSKRALLFDGFLDRSGLTSSSAGIMVRDGAARLSAAGQETLTSARTGNTAFLGDRSCGTGEHTAAGGGVLRSLTLYWYPADANYVSGSTLTVTRNGVRVLTQAVTFPAGGSSPMTIPLSAPVELVRGDRFSLALGVYGSSRAAHVYLNTQGTMAGSINIDPLGASSGTLTARAADIGGSGERTVAFVRYAGGSVTPTVDGGAMTRTGRRTNVNLRGESCTEDTFEGPGVSGSVAVGFALECGSDAECVFYDYGVAVL